MGCSNSNSSESIDNQGSSSNKSNTKIGEIRQNTVTKEKNNQIIIENNLILNKESIRDQY